MIIWWFMVIAILKYIYNTSYTRIGSLLAADISTASLFIYVIYFKQSPFNSNSGQLRQFKISDSDISSKWKPWGKESIELQLRINSRNKLTKMMWAQLIFQHLNLRLQPGAYSLGPDGVGRNSYREGTPQIAHLLDHLTLFSYKQKQWDWFGKLLASRSFLFLYQWICYG